MDSIEERQGNSGIAHEMNRHPNAMGINLLSKAVQYFAHCQQHEVVGRVAHAPLATRSKLGTGIGRGTDTGGRLTFVLAGVESSAIGSRGGNEADSTETGNLEMHLNTLVQQAFELTPKEITFTPWPPRSFTLVEASWQVAEKVVYSEEMQAKTPTPQRRISSLRACGVGLRSANLVFSAGRAGQQRQTEPLTEEVS